MMPTAWWMRSSADGNYPGWRGGRAAFRSLSITAADNIRRITNWKATRIRPAACTPELIIPGRTTTARSTSPNLFVKETTRRTAFGYAFPGETGLRNQLRGPGFFGVDLGLGEAVEDAGGAKAEPAVSLEVFNVTNSVRFDVQSANATRREPGERNSANFGNLRRHVLPIRASCNLRLRYEFSTRQGPLKQRLRKGDFRSFSRVHSDFTNHLTWPILPAEFLDKG